MKRKILKQMKEWLDNFGIPWSQYRISLEIEETYTGKDAFLTMEHRRTGATIQIDSIELSLDGEVIQFNNPNLTVR